MKKWETDKGDQGFSLKRHLDENQDSSSSKKKPMISLSKSRRNVSSLKSIKIDPDIKKEATGSQWNEDIKVKLEENVETNVNNVEIKLRIRNDVSVFNEIEDKAKIEKHAYNVIKIEDNSQENTLMMNIEGMCSQKDTDAYNCPLCNQDLSNVKSSYSRQKHVEDCLLSEEKKHTSEALDFDNCVFCGKYLKHFNADRQHLHVNRCLDSLAEIEEGASSEKDTYAGQEVPFLKNLEICLVCHEFAPFVNRQVRQKIAHIKQCSRRNKVNLSELLKKFKWMSWGHFPLAKPNQENLHIPVNVEEREFIANNVNSKEIVDLAPTFVKHAPQHELVAYGVDFKEDPDFNQRIFFHKKLNTEYSKKHSDKNDEELQTALAMSLSMKEEKRKERIRPTDERDWNAANIISMEESRLKALAKLDEILFPLINDEHRLKREQSMGILGPSRIPSIDLFCWNFASNA